MKNENLVPKVRFKGFSDPWEQRKLADVATITGRIGYRGYTRNDIVTYDVGILTYSPSNILDNKLHQASKDTYITQSKYDESPEIKVKRNEILFVKTGSTLGKSALVDIDVKATINPQLVIIKTKNCDSTFLSNTLITENVLKQIHSSKIGGAVPTLTEKEISQFAFSLPKINEQKSISAVFSQTASLIAANEDKLKQLKELKRLLMQKIFSQEWRFKGFTDPWEQRKLKDIAIKAVQKNKNLQYTLTLTNSATQGVVKQLDYFDKRISNKNIENYYVIHAGEFVYNPRISKYAPYGPIRMNTLQLTGIMSPLYTVFSVNKVNNTFAEYYFKTTSWHKFMYQNGDSGARADRFSIKDELFFEMPIAVPKISEQKRIGNVLKRLGSLIAANEDKLKQLKELKRFLMKNMFI